jgi:hypothetical protein
VVGAGFGAAAAFGLGAAVVVVVGAGAAVVVVVVGAGAAVVVVVVVAGSAVATTRTVGKVPADAATTTDSASGSVNRAGRSASVRTTLTSSQTRRVEGKALRTGGRRYGRRNPFAN